MKANPPPALEFSEWTKGFRQEGDACKGAEQSITVSQEDGGGGPFWVIETERWSVDSIDELVELLEQAGVGRRAPEALIEVSLPLPNPDARIEAVK